MWVGPHHEHRVQGQDPVPLGLPGAGELSQHRWDVGAGRPGERGPVLVWMGDWGGRGVPASCEGRLGSDAGGAGSHSATGKEVVVLGRTRWNC